MTELYQLLASEEEVKVPNPYNISTPVTGAQFFGQETLFSSIQALLASTDQNALLISGLARVGKTSLLQELLVRLQSKTLVPVYWGLKDQAELSSVALWKALGKSITKQIHLRPSQLPSNFNDFETEFLPRIEKTIEPRRLVLLLDDIDNLTHSPAETAPFLADIGQLLDQEHPPALILSSSKKSHELPLWLAQIPAEELSFLAPLETFFLITSLSKQTPINYSFETSGKIWKLTGGHPYFVQLVCHETFQFALENNSQKVDLAVLNQVIPRALKRGAPELAQSIADLSEPALHTLAACAALFGQHPITPHSVGHVLDQNSLVIEAEALPQLLNQLKEQSFLEVNKEGSFGFIMPLLAFWLHKRYPFQFIIPAERPPVSPVTISVPAAPTRPSQRRFVTLVGGGLIVLAVLIGFFRLDINNNQANVPATSTVASLAAFTTQPELTPTATEPPTSSPAPTFVPTLTPVEAAAFLPTATAVPTLPPTATAFPTSLPTHTPLPTTSPTPAPAATATLSPSPTATPPPASPTATTLPPPTPTPNVPSGQFILLSPVALDQPSYGLTEFEWQWTGPIPPDAGFEVRVWREGEPQMGVHDAVFDNQNDKIESLGENKYRLKVDITGAAGVQGYRGEYWWTVALVQIDPGYADLGLQAPPALMRFEPKDGGGGGDSGDSGGGSSVGVD